MEVNTMKAINLAKGISKLLALMLAMVMLFTACGGNPEDDPANADGSSSTSETNPAAAKSPIIPAAKPTVAETRAVITTMRKKARFGKLTISKTYRPT